MEISEERLDNLLDAESMMQSLEAGGVDNWEFYDISLEAYRKEKEEREAAIIHDREKAKFLEDLFISIEEKLCEGITEPAGSNCGYGFNDTEGDEAFKQFQNGVAKYVDMFFTT